MIKGCPETTIEKYHEVNDRELPWDNDRKISWGWR